MKTIRNDEAVSPVIGVILMVAITVILAAVIAAFVFGLAGTTGSSKNVGLTVTQNAAGLGVVTVQGGTDIPTISNLKYSVDGGTTYKFFAVSATSGAATTTGGTVVVGSVLYTQGGDTLSGNRFIVTGLFDDGSSQVLFDRQY
ncbi:flagellin-like protein [Methanolinea mesophila]|uniref:type IV pilin n=1 Tax=Methanolinea mesophila TaxID=547055 RepID=UPI001FD76CDB|nr:type IV pilin N-terminal domain-containing protein [Methanolinea mesophila]MBP1928230.1 flagellin-like protein [Methanolinea mesophila]